jgi:Xaa-Pro aminopeptidase
MERFLYWLETEVASGREITEWEASEMLTSLRADIPGYRGNSFENISAYGANAALPHYSTPEEGSSFIKPSGLYLVDSGGQYLTGTTDITRTVPMGECTNLQKEDYTLVLKGMIDLSMAVFPKGTAGCQIDALARMPLWKAKRNFGHGTGHGIGYYLCVHEGPQSIRYQYNPQPLLPGMVTSNEPGLYREGMHGIRHENIVLCKEAGSSEFGHWLDFETLTCCHIDTSAILPELVNKEELDWLNSYNEHVFRTLSPLLPEHIAQWLRIKTLPLK